MKKTTLLIAFGISVLTSAAQAQGVARYVGTDGNWFNPRNWSTGRVPGPTTDVMIAGDARVIIDPALGTGPVEIRDLLLKDRAYLETRPGTRFFTRHELISGHSYLRHRSTEAGSTSNAGTFVKYVGGTTLIVSSYNGWHLNPSTQSHRDVILLSHVRTNLELGGAAPASPSGLGRGHYATIQADNVVLGGKLGLGVMYGFQPEPGQKFQIITANRIAVGQFRDLPEGALAARFGDVGLYITYEGGDGNDVVLEARRLAPTP